MLGALTAGGEQRLSEAMKSFQEKNNLPATGKLDEQTLAVWHAIHHWQERQQETKLGAQ
jgi:Putative peptidoglycan binding domain